MENIDYLYQKAFEIAQKVHGDQFDKGGNPYMEHPLFVAQQVDQAELKIVALLHDTLEDSELTAEDLEREGFPVRIVDAIRTLTHEDSGEDAYMEYIKRVAEDPWALEVKKADLCHNMDLSRIQNPTEKDLARCEKYKKALQYLNSIR